MWDYSAGCYKKRDESVSFDYDHFIDYIREILEDGMDIEIFDYGSGGGPGWDSSMWICYCKKPHELMLVVETIVLGNLDVMVQKEDHSK